MNRTTKASMRSFRRVWCSVVAFIVSGLVISVAVPGWACSTFKAIHTDASFEGDVVVGHSFDFTNSAGLLVFNPRGEKKMASLVSVHPPAVWISRYSSVTFNQFGVGYPIHGMNEAGLVFAQMSLHDDTEYPDFDGRPIVMELQLIQYALDNFATVQSMISGIESVNVERAMAGLHYLACDTSGECAVIEYLNGELVVTSGNDLRTSVLTNSIYSESVAELAQYVGFGGSKPIPTGLGILERFIRLTYLVRAPLSGQLPDAAFTVLDSVFQPDSSGGIFTGTCWQVVYIPQEGRIYWRTIENNSTKFADIDRFNQECISEFGLGRMILDIDFNVAGDASDSFAPYTRAANRDLLERAFSTVPDWLMPPELREKAIEEGTVYPESFVCTIDEDILFGPVIYSPNWEPSIHMDAFPAQTDQGFRFKLIVTNGDQDGGQAWGTRRVSSAIIRVNGFEVVGPQDLSLSVDKIEIPLELEEHNTISAEIWGMPASYLTVQVAYDPISQMPKHR